MPTASRRQPRLEPLEPPFAADVAEALDGVMPPGVSPIALFRVVARSPRVMWKLRGGNFLDRGALSLRQRELLILRTTALLGAEHEWGVHVAFFAERAGLTAAEIADTAAASIDPGLWPEVDLPFLRLAEALHRDGAVDDALWQALAARHKDEVLIEAVAVCGFYRMIGYLVNALHVPNEPGAPLFPAG